MERSASSDADKQAPKRNVVSQDETKPRPILKKLCGKLEHNFLNASESSESSHITSSPRTSRSSVTFATNVLFQQYVHHNESESLQLLLQSCNFKEIDRLDYRGLSPIHWAALLGYSECTVVLIRSGANIENVDPHGWTPLHAAVAADHVRCVEVLIKSGANARATTNQGESVLDLVRSERVRSILQGCILADRTKQV